MTKTEKLQSSLIVAITLLLLLAPGVHGQGDGKKGGGAKPVTVPVTIRLKEERREYEIRTVDYILKEDGELQTILSIRKPSESPITLAILIQDDLVTSIANETKGIANFIKRLPPGSRVMVGYIRSGSLDVRRKFTVDMEKAASGLRAPLGLASASPFNPYIEIIEALRRFDSQPLGRRAIVVVSDGVDTSRGIDSSSPSQSLDLQRAINQAQRLSVPIYSIYAPTVGSSGGDIISLNGQSCLQRLSHETGGVAFFQGTGAPVSFDPFIKEIDASISMQLALSYLSTHSEKGFHRLEIKPLERDVEIRHPSGYPR
jgi:VWFA-related protein